MDPQSEGLRLPEGLELLEKIGASKSASVYKASYMGETIALKAYTARAIDWYRKKQDVNLAVFEMSQNRAFRKVAALVPYTAKPLRVIGQDGQSSLCFLQEFVDGLSLGALTEKLGRVPGSLLTAGELIDRTCEDEGLEGLDQFMQNILLRERSGQWVPVLHDFKHIPVPRAATGKNSSLLARLGLGRKDSARAGAGFLGEWRMLDERLTKKGA